MQSVLWLVQPGGKSLNRGKLLRYLFDLTTTAQWRGSSVGIVRVERELARRARRHLGKDVAFCLYDRSHAAILVIDDAVVDDIIAGRIRVIFPEHRVAQAFDGRIGRKIRRVVLQNTTVYYLSQRIRGRSITRDQILRIQALELAKGNSELPPHVRAAAPHPREAMSVSLAKLPLRPARLDANTMIISGGLDWQYKNLRALWALKQTYGFLYCAIVYDLIAIRFPQFVVPGYVELLTDYFGELTWLADRAMCISEVTRQDWLRHIYELGAQPVTSSVFPLGCDLFLPTEDLAVNLPPPLEGKQFALYVSTIEPRKNHRMIYEAWEECIRSEQFDPEHHRLVFVGRRGWAVGDLLREIEINPLTRETIVFLDDVSDEQLANLYQTCSFVLFPSNYEGFGLPLAEALGYGKPCVSSDAGALSEIGGDLVIRLDPKDTLAWSRMISRLMSSSPERRAWETRVKRDYRATTWDDAAAIFFSKVASSGHSEARIDESAARPQSDLRPAQVSAAKDTDDEAGPHVEQSRLPAVAIDPQA